VTRGTATGNLVAGENVNAVVTGYISRKAAGILSDAGVKIYTGASGKVKTAFEDFKSGRLQEMTSVPEGKDV
jgi:predicted Fe-Mo cluster-binding NifX family protein